MAGMRLHLQKPQHVDRVAQIIARFLRREMLLRKRRFSFETVFSHPSNLDIMKEAAASGYKVYLYFVSTESPEINKYRVALRVKKGGHDVPADRIEDRYYRSLSLLKEAIGISYQVYCFDNSFNDQPFRLVSHGKLLGNDLVWDEMGHTAKWFDKYYTNKA